MSKNKAENAIIKFLILSHLSTKVLRCNKVQKLKHSFPNVVSDCVLRESLGLLFAENLCVSVEFFWDF